MKIVLKYGRASVKNKNKIFLSFKVTKKTGRHILHSKIRTHKKNIFSKPTIFHRERIILWGLSL